MTGSDKVWRRTSARRTDFLTHAGRPHALHPPHLLAFHLQTHARTAVRRDASRFTAPVPERAALPCLDLSNENWAARKAT